jgi:hypothetical protein
MLDRNELCTTRDAGDANSLGKPGQRMMRCRIEQETTIDQFAIRTGKGSSG